MYLIELTGRQDEPAILRVLERSHGSAEALSEARSRYGPGEWMFLGLQDGAEIVACAGAERLDSGTIGIRSIAVEPHRRGQGLGRTLIDALAERLGAQRVVAEADDEAVGFYRRCGFVVDDAPAKFGRRRYWCVRELGDLDTPARASKGTSQSQNPARPPSVEDFSRQREPFELAADADPSARDWIAGFAPARPEPERGVGYRARRIASVPWLQQLRAARASR